jgi:Spy/CpxP family protein refolding chaperone
MLALIEDNRRRLLEMRRDFSFGFLSLTLALTLAGWLAVATFASSASAQKQGAPPRPYPPGLSEALLIQQRAEALGLSEEVQAKLQVLLDEVKPARDQLQEESGEILQKLHALLDQPLPDEKELIAAGAATGEVAKKMRDQRLTTTLRARGLLSEEQLTKFMDIRGRVQLPRGAGGRNRR